MNRQDSRTPNRSELLGAEGVLRETIFPVLLTPGKFRSLPAGVMAPWRLVFWCRSLEREVGLARRRERPAERGQRQRVEIAAVREQVDLAPVGGRGRGDAVPRREILVQPARGGVGD